MKEFIEKLIGRFLAECVIYAENYEKALDMANQLAEEHNNGWIPCSERLPDHMQTVLFTSEDGYVDCGWYDADKNWCVNDNYFPNAFRFIAWKPLPESYQPPAAGAER